MTKMTPIHQNYAVCSACNDAFVCTQQNVYPDDGWVLPFEIFGYYGGFSDSIEVLFDKRPSKQWIFCHDCVVKFFDTFPLLVESFAGGHHPCDDDVPCCQFAWRGTENFAKHYDQMLVRTQSAVKTREGNVVWMDDEPCTNGV